MIMNKVWSELNKIMQVQIKKKDTYEAGIATLFDLRNQLMEGLIVIRYYLALRGAENSVTAMVTPFFCVQG